MMKFCCTPTKGMMQYNSLDVEKLGLLHACLQGVVDSLERGLAPELLLLLLLAVLELT
jgi:hypothetical protein